MAGTALAQGSSVTLTVAATDSILIDSNSTGTAVIEAVSGVTGAANAARLANHRGGQAVYGPFGAGTVKLSAVGGTITYVQGSAPITDDSGSPSDEVVGLSPYDGSADASNNVARIQAALNGRGRVQILVPGTYYINDTLVIPSNTELILGAGVTLRMVSGGNKSVLRNYNFTATRTAVTGNPTASGTTITVSATAHGLAVGDYACLMGSTVDGYEGIFPVASVPDANSLTLTADYQPANATSSGTCYIRKADVNITISGPGVFDQDRANQTLSGVENHAIRLQGVRYLNLLNPVVQNANKYAIHLITVQDFKVDRPTFPITNSDGLHIEGFARSGLITQLTGKTGDDMLAFTCMKLSPAAAYAYTVPSNYHPGNQLDIDVFGVAGKTGQALVKVTGTTGYTFDRIHIAGINGYFKTAGISIIDDSADLTGMSIGKIVFDGIQPRVSGDASGSVYIITYNATATVSELVFRDYVMDTSSLITGAATFSGTSATSIGKLTVDGFSTLAGGAPVVVGWLMGSNLTLSEWVLNRVTWNGGANASARLVNQTGGTISDFKGSNWKLLGNSAANGYYHSGGALTAFEITNVQGSGVRSVYENTTGATATPEGVISNVLLNGSMGQLVNLSQSTNLLASNIRAASIGNNVIQLGATSKTFNFRLSNISCSASQYWNYGTTNTINLWADGTVPVDGSKVTVSTTTKGATFFNNNAAFGTGEGLYSVSNAGAAVKLT